ncbi:MAG: class I SAM-dependent DNA methyltransferase, partial [Pontibacterium sp.]
QQNSKIRCLDLGCGTGLVADALTPYAGDLELTGVDLSAGMLKLAKDKARYRHLIQADLTKFSAPAGHYHIIIAADVFIYLGDLKPVFTKVANLLSPEGLFAFTLEAGDSHTQLMKSGRFSHSTQYIDHLITNTQFTTLSQQRFALRLENNEPVEGLLYLVQKAI